MNHARLAVDDINDRVFASLTQFVVDHWVVLSFLSLMVVSFWILAMVRLAIEDRAESFRLIEREEVDRG